MGRKTSRTALETVVRYLSGRKTPATLGQVQKSMKGQCAESTVQRTLSKLVLRDSIVRNTTHVNGRNVTTFVAA